jgi:hypothetical protein
VAERTIRSMVADIQRELLTGDLTPGRSRELLIEATALFGNCSTEVREAEIAYNRVLVEHLDGRGDEPANRATIRAKGTPAYERWREASDTLKVVVKTCSTLKATMRNLEEEMRLSR